MFSECEYILLRFNLSCKRELLPATGVTQVSVNITQVFLKPARVQLTSSIKIKSVSYLCAVGSINILKYCIVISYIYCV